MQFCSAVNVDRNSKFKYSMSDTKIFSLGDNGMGGGNNMLAMLPALLQRQGVDPNLVALCQGRGQNGWGGDGIFGILLLFILMGAFNGNGFGFGGGNRGCWGGNGGVVPMLNNDANTAVIMQAVQRNGFDISTLATALNTSSDAVMAAINALGGQICNLGNQLGLGQRDIITAVTQGNNGIISQMCDCCCSLKTLVTEQGYQGQLRTIQQTQDIIQNATSNANVIAAKIDAQTQIINDKFCQLEMREMQRENQNLRDQLQGYILSASQQQQTANIVAQLQPTPRPAYIVANPYGCGCNNFGIPFNNGCNGGCNNGCGC